MHLHLLQHSPHQGPARLADWLVSMGHSHTIFHLDTGEAPPRLSDCDALVVLDGPLSAKDQAAPAWLARERKLIERALDSNKPLLGIGFGARLIADALGAVVAPGTYAETGWQRVTLAADSAMDLPEQFDAFMWHREVFALPEDALPVGGSEASPVQGFSWDAGRVVGLLCHLEATSESVTALLDHLATPAGSTTSPHAQDREAMLADDRRFDRLAPLLDRVLSQWLRTTNMP
ncbi:type 1 glutamine amidotransferase [Halomonas urumqiensis]|uniref:Glutamine amidotransferase n=1 Tax=Halomonas urumqiensis TaxID=1684789 RepID=A0A2N7UL87_9GAMM|nr:type 1 glutamine amidotransferase [Halomonas urumqiensis]PMR81211.1 glutamine amidotransferase [Halomonas urumqiensis]PTB01778.1 type 1 glutamine amidotransferase [Halomonas urumqiensis]GHE22117.1 GMP synthase [Halomonas urumqiensis]